MQIKGYMRMMNVQINMGMVKWGERASETKKSFAGEVGNGDG